MLIVTRYLPPNGDKGGRIQAWLPGPKRKVITVPHDGPPNETAAHAAAAIALSQRLGLGGTWAAGSAAYGYLWIRTDGWMLPTPDD